MGNVISIIQLLWPVIGGMIGGYAWFHFFHKKERRLFKNIQRPITIIATEDKPMAHEAKLLERVGFFNVGTPSSDVRAVDVMNGSRLVIIGYSPNSQIFKDSFNAAKQREMPVIVYAGPTHITDEDMKLLQSYSHHSMCNTPLRLISDVFVMMGTYPEDKI
ncbi:MAG: hypothetical protein RI947_225 [Candidatus Parcubacteria bacterium]|jgi:hypothetical protein